MFKHITVPMLILMVVCTNSYASQYKSDQVTLQVLDSGGPESDDGWHFSGHLIWYKNKA